MRKGESFSIQRLQENKKVSKTVKALRFCSTYKLTGQPVQSLGAGRRHKSPESKTETRDEGLITHYSLHSRQHELNVCIISSFPPSLTAQCGATHTKAARTAEPYSSQKPQLRKHSVKEGLGRNLKQTSFYHPDVQKADTASLGQSCYIHLLKKIIWNKNC